MSAEQPFVSVIIPAYNVTTYISETLDSVCGQSYRDFEIILVNDGCPDTVNLERALEPYRDRIRYIRQPNSGPSAARNTGIRASTAPLIAFLDSDDLWEPEYLSTHVRMLTERPDIDLVYPNAYIFDGERLRDKTTMSTLPSRGEPNFENLVLRECYVYTSVTARREAVIRAGMYDESLKYAEDYDLWLRMALTGSRLTNHTRPLAWYRRSRPDSLSRDYIRMINGIITVYQKLLAMPNLTADARTLVEKALEKENADLDFCLGKAALYQSRREEAIERLARANRVLHSSRISAILWGLRVAPGILGRYVRRRYPSERAFLNGAPGSPAASS